MAALPGLDARSLRLAAAIPEGYRAAPTRARWLRWVQEHPAIAGLRPDAAEVVRLICHGLARHVDYGSMTTRPGHRLIAAACGLDIDHDAHRRRLLRWLRWLRAQRIIGHVEAGSTEQYRPGQDGHGSRAAEYVLLTPRRPRAAITTDTPSYPADLYSPLRARARSYPQPNASLRSAGEESPQEHPELRPPWPSRQVCRTRSDRLAAAETLRRWSPVLARITARHLRAILRPWLAAGWTIADIRHALDHHPDGQPHRYAYRVADLRHPPGWVAHRLRLWADPDGHPLPGPITTAEARAATRRAAETTRAAAEAARAAETAHTADRAAIRRYQAEIRAILAARGRSRLDEAIAQDNAEAAERRATITHRRR